MHMGDETDNILPLLGLSDDDKKSYKTVKAKLNGHFVSVKTLSKNEQGLTRENKKRVKV